MNVLLNNAGIIDDSDSEVLSLARLSRAPEGGMIIAPGKAAEYVFSALKIPTGFRLKAQGCESASYPGWEKVRA